MPAVLAETRLNFRNGATQFKIMAGGGGSSRFDPIDTTQFSKEETCAVVEAVKDWGTYVAAHVFTDRAMNCLMECDVKSFEHAFFMAESTMKKIAEKGIFVVPQMWGISPDMARNPLMPKDKIPMVLELGKKFKDFGRNLLKRKVKVVFASDYVGEFADAERAHRVAPHIHRVFSNLKTWINGTHHGVTPKYLQSYLDEFVFRFNRRNTPMAAFQTLLGISTRKTPLSLRNLVVLS